MSTVFYTRSEADFPRADVSVRPSRATNESKSSNVLRSLPLSKSQLRKGSYARSHSHTSEDDLVTAAQGGDQHAFVELCGRHSSIAKRKILKIVRNHADAEDALQDTLLRAYTNLASFRRSCKFATWLSIIGVNSALMVVRRRRVRREVYDCANSPDTGILELHEPVDRALGPEGIYLQRESALLLRREVEKLKPSLRSIVDNYYGSECTLEEAAHAQEISVAAAKSRLLRGRSRLRSSLVRNGISASCN